MRKWLNTLKDIWSIEELWGRIQWTVACVFIFRLGTFILLPGLDPSNIEYIRTGKILSLLDSLLSSSALNSSSILSLGIAPYISASIIIQFASFTVPYFQRLKKEGAAGKAQLNWLTRLFALAIAPLKAASYAVYIISQHPDRSRLLIPEYWFAALTVLLLTAGSMFSIWLADRINAKGVGSGTSVLLTANLLSGVREALYLEYTSGSLFGMLIEFAIFCFLLIVITKFLQGVRKIPLQYASQMRQNFSGFQGGQQHLPLGMNIAGVMPIIFAKTLTALPLFVAKMLASRSVWATTVAAWLEDKNGWGLNGLLALLIFFGNFFYAAVFINVNEMSNDLKANGAFLPGVQPGRATAAYIDDVLNKISYPSSLFLVVVSCLPILAFKLGITEKLSDYFGGTSLLILVGTILDIGQRIESELFRTHYGKILMTPQTLLEREKSAS